MAEAPWRARDSVLCGAICFLLLVLLHQIQTRASLSDLSSTIDETREVATDLSMEHQRLAAELARLEKAVAMSTGKPLPSLPPLDGARGYDGTPHAVQYRSTVPGGLGCVGWRQTGGCAADGPRESDADKGCETRILSKWSGYCECENGTTTHAVGCLHADFTCATACEQQPALAACAADPHCMGVSTPWYNGAPWAVVQSSQPFVPNAASYGCTFVLSCP